MIERLFKFYAAKKIYGPIQLVLFITSKCNCFCRHCFYWKELNQQDQLTIDEYKQIASNVGRIRTLCLTGGEPFLRSDIVEIVKIFSAFNRPKYVQIPTNGMLTNIVVDTCKGILLNTNLKLNISVSLDGFEEIHNDIRGNKNCFNHAVETIRELKLLSKSSREFTVTVCTNISSLTIDKIKEFAAFVKNNLKPDMHMFEIIRGDLQSNAIKEIDDNKLNDIYNFIEEYSDKFDEDFFSKRETFMGKASKYLLKKQYNNCKNIFLHKDFNYKCYIPNLSNVIYHDGKVSFCEGIDLKLNIRDYDYNLIKLTKSKDYLKGTENSRNCKCTNGMYQGYNTVLNHFRSN